ncbi:MAG TPA: SlyX family protein [Rhizobiaceae bacterium]|nr:SlyX family protein [Rhizobiaceae bacterium]
MTGEHESDLRARIEVLETHVAHQARTIEELNEVVTAQARVIDTLRRKVDLLTERFLAVEEAVQDRPGNAPPPHW